MDIPERFSEAYEGEDGLHVRSDGPDIWLSHDGLAVAFRLTRFEVSYILAHFPERRKK